MSGDYFPWSEEAEEAYEQFAYRIDMEVHMALLAKIDAEGGDISMEIEDRNRELQQEELRRSEKVLARRYNAKAMGGSEVWMFRVDLSDESNPMLVAVNDTNWEESLTPTRFQASDCHDMDSFKKNVITLVAELAGCESTDVRLGAWKSD